MLKTTHLLEVFREKSRELFNSSFRLDQPWSDSERAWLLVEKFRVLEAEIFQKIVGPAVPGLLPLGSAQPKVIAKINSADGIIFNRQINSPYWDYELSLSDLPIDFVFVDFFDWDMLGERDFRYARLAVSSCATSAELIGKHALIESDRIEFLIEE